MIKLILNYDIRNSQRMKRMLNLVEDWENINIMIWMQWLHQH